jgi:hypothetical protein
MIRSCSIGVRCRETTRILVNDSLSARFCNKDTANERIPVQDALLGVAIQRK